MIDAALPLASTREGRIRRMAFIRRMGTSGLLALAALGAVLLAVGAGPLLWRVDPDRTNLTNRYAGFSRPAPLGTDELGRDILSRLLHGGRLSLAGAVVVLVGSSGAGLAVGALAGAFGGRTDILISRVVDGLLALPALVVALGIVGVLGKSFVNLLLALVLTGWPWYARIYRGFVLREQQMEYVTAATALGAGRARVVWRHIGPNIVGPALVLATVSLGGAILSLASLSFLGLGVQPPRAEWGAMVNGARSYFQTHPWLIVTPGLAISATVLSVNILGDALWDATDPRRRPI